MDENWVRSLKRKELQALREKILAAIRYRLGEEELLAAKLAQERKHKIKYMARACQLQTEAVKCEKKAEEAEKNIQELMRQLEAIRRNREEGESVKANEFSLQDSIVSPLKQTIQDLTNEISSWGRGSTSPHLSPATGSQNRHNVSPALRRVGRLALP